MTTILNIKKTTLFTCEKCDFKCSKKGNYDNHLLTKKHKSTTIYNKTQQTCETNKEYACECGKLYNHRASLFNHKKKCTYKAEQEPVQKTKLYEKDIVDVLMKENTDFKNIILDLVKSNTDLQKQMMEVCMKSGINNNTINSHNKTFNMQIFLNEQCKDAMNIMEFVNTMTLEFSDLEDVGKLGYVEGLSNIIIRKLNELDIYKRPIHCSDGKREIMYVKDENIWEKENSTYDKLRKAIKRVTYTNSSLLEPWSRAHPQCMNNQHQLNDVYVQMMGQAMGGRESFVESENKIVKRIAKAVLIDKTC
jgi:hypothetical protein